MHKVLVAGGNNGSYLSSFEIYDPLANSSSDAASLTTARYGHTATLLMNGKVLVVGGESASGNVIASAELFDPTNNTWSPAY